MDECVAMQLSGFADPRFAPVRDAFAANFAERGELGAALHVTVDGKPVVDLWGGSADPRTGRPWKEDTLVIVFSSTKGATAACAHLLASRGELDLDRPVAHDWPEFAAAGKQGITLRQVLTHSAGLAAVDEPLPAEAIYDWSRMIGAIAAQPPLWPPGQGHGYHAITFGFLVGELVRRRSGKSLGSFFRSEIAGPLGLDFWIGLPEAHEARVAPVRMAPPLRTPTPLFRAMMERGSLTWKAFMNPRGMLTSSHANSRATHAAEIPASNGITNARGLAGLYTPYACGNRWRGVPLADLDSLRAMTTVAVEGDDRVLLLPTRFSAGFMKSVDNGERDSARFGPNAEAFGHVGAGGSFGMADPVARIAIGYVMNQLGHGVLLNHRGQSLIDAVYASLR
jgi:CubicO group peptidase (beta-lactamase class C family)